MLTHIQLLQLVEWFSSNYQKFGCKLEFVTNKSQEGSQFCKGFGGVGGFLRYRCDFLHQVRCLIQNWCGV